MAFDGECRKCYTAKNFMGNEAKSALLLSWEKDQKRGNHESCKRKVNTACGMFCHGGHPFGDGQSIRLRCDGVLTRQWVMLPD